MRREIDIAGQKFGRLTAVERVDINKHGVWRWRFSCDCSGETIQIPSVVRSGKVKSCGCLAREMRELPARYAEIISACQEIVQSRDSVALNHALFRMYKRLNAWGHATNEPHMFRDGPTCNT